MKISKLYVLIAIVALVVAVPLSSVLAKRDGQLKMERSNSQQLQLKIDSVEKQLEQKNLEEEKLKQENEKLKAEVQAKAELKRKQEIAKAEEAERARQASVAISAGGAQYSGGGNCEAYRGLVSQYGWNVNVAMAVMKAESGCNTQAHNTTDNHGVCMGSFGLFQISCHSGAVYDPAQNIAIAWQKYSSRGWQPWGVCTSGKVSCY
ncbi:MAG: hypothetical protein WC822_06380 [Candidatus Paceibacterota bacterium]|jgi:TolA-binding protein